jgi:tetratricopeptide (TPR) repeat protein
MRFTVQVRGGTIEAMLNVRWAAIFLLPALCAPAFGAGLDTTDQRFQSALAHYNSGQYAAAQQELEGLEREAPRSFDVQELLGLVYSAEGQEAKATPRFEEAVELQPNSGPARNNLATSLARLGKDTLAEKEFKKVLELEPASYDANHNLAEFYIARGQVGPAVPYLERAGKAEPGAYDNGYDLALAYEKTGRLREAAGQIQALLKQKDTAELHDMLGAVDEESGDYVAAVNEYQSAAHMDPSESNLFDWGGELLMHQTSGPAIQVFSAGLERYPDSPRLALGLGLALYLQGSYDDAVKALMRATDLAQADPRAYYFLSKAYDQSPNQAAEVTDRFRRFAELRPKDADAKFDYAMSLWKGKRSETDLAYLSQVEALLKKSIALDPSSSQAHLQLGNLYSQLRKYDQAVPEYKEALRLSADIPDAHFRLGQAYVHLGQQELAGKEFEIHQQLYQRHLAEVDKQRSEIKQFVYSAKAAPAGP